MLDMARLLAPGEALSDQTLERWSKADRKEAVAQATCQTCRVRKKVQNSSLLSSLPPIEGAREWRGGDERNGGGQVPRSMGAITTRS